MPLQGHYKPSPVDRLRQQVADFESSQGQRGNTVRDLPIIVATTKGARTGNLRKTPLMRVEHKGKYLIVASLGGAPKHPLWYFNVVANPTVEIQDGAGKQDMTARELTGAEREEWWKRAVDAFPPYADYQRKTSRLIPILLCEPVGS